MSKDFVHEKGVAMDPRLARVWLFSFGDSRLIKARRRLFRQAVGFGIPEDHICISSENELDEGFRFEMKKHLVLGSRGYGYWCWKPEVCLEAFRKMKDGDILLYLDIGCHLNRKGKSRFYDYLVNVEDKDFLGFQYRSLLSTEVPDARHHFNLVSHYTKGDVLDYFGIRNNERILASGQLLAAAFFMKKCAKTIAFCEEWKNVASTDFALQDDSPSKSSNAFEPCRHRHDQSSFSILWMLKNLPTLSACEIEQCRRRAPAPAEFRHNSNWGHSWFWQMAAYPIQARRDLGTRSVFVKAYRYLKYYHILPLLRRLFMRGGTK